MAAPSTTPSSALASSETTGNYTVPLMLMISLFFMFGFITVLNDVLIPHLKQLFKLSSTEAMLVQFCFFGAYFIMSIPAGLIINKIGYKKGLVVALLVLGCGLLLFIPASITVYYPFFLFALFVSGSGMTVLQVAANAYISLLGNPAGASARLNLAGALNSFATTIGPLVGAAFIFIDERASDAAKAEAVRGPYIVLAIFAFALALLMGLAKLPELIPAASKAEATKGGKGAWGYQHLVLGAVAIFFYVGAEVAIGSILIDYLKTSEMGALDKSVAASFVAYYWCGAMIGRFIGFFVLQRIRAEKGLMLVSLCALLLVAISMTGFALSHWLTIPVVDLKNLSFSNPIQVQVPLAALLIVLVGMCNSIMWPCIFPLSLVGLGKHTSQGSSILVMMIVGGAIMPVLQGALADITHNYQLSFVLVLVCYAYILYFAIKGHKTGDVVVEENPANLPVEELA